jgi:cell division protease FtsH
MDEAHGWRSDSRRFLSSSEWAFPALLGRMDSLWCCGTVSRVQSSDQKPTQDQQNAKPAWRRLVTPWQIALAATLALMLSIQLQNGGTKNVTLAEVREAIKEKNVEEARVFTATRILELKLEDGTKISSGYVEDDAQDVVKSLETSGAKVTVTGEQQPSQLMGLLYMLLPIGLIIGAMMLLSRKMPGSMMDKFGKQSNREPVRVPETRFADVAGADEALEDLREVVEFLRDPERYEKLGARIPRGVLLEGPPGTGKTLLARATAGEAQVPFFALSGSDFVEMFAGVGASRVRAAFEKARKAERAIVFIDEIDAIGKKRSASGMSGGVDERENTLNALLVEMDGFEKSGVVVIAATNRQDVLDAALLRPGRFDRKVGVTIPDRRGREKLFALYLKSASLSTDLAREDAAERLAGRSMGMTGADIAAVVNEAALSAAKLGATGIEMAHLHDALERVMLGRERRSVQVSDWAKEVTAWHEAGHTVCALLVDSAWKPERVSIVPRGGAGGATWFSTDDEHFITKSRARAELIVGLGGRAAEEILLNGDVTQGASNDLMQATARAERMICDWGMTGTLAYVNRERVLTEDTEIRQRVEQMLQSAMREAAALLEGNRDLLEEIARELREVETLDRDDLAKIRARVEAARHSA